MQCTSFILLWRVNSDINMTVRRVWLGSFGLFQWVTDGSGVPSVVEQHFGATGYIAKSLDCWFWHLSLCTHSSFSHSSQKSQGHFMLGEGVRLVVGTRSCKGPKTADVTDYMSFCRQWCWVYLVYILLPITPIGHPTNTNHTDVGHTSDCLWLKGLVLVRYLLCVFELHQVCLACWKN